MEVTILKNLKKRLRPLSFDDFAGQDQVLENLKVLLLLLINVTRL
jgi:Holliday junction resolvasome RuvABC ATP-dependent DNA helicase subunit